MLLYMYCLYSNLQQIFSYQVKQSGLYVKVNEGDFNPKDDFQYLFFQISVFNETWITILGRSIFWANE